MELQGIEYVDMRASVAANRATQAEWPRLEDVRFIGVHHSGADNTFEADFAWQVQGEGWWHGGYHLGIEADGTIKYGLDAQYQAYQLGCMPFENAASFPESDPQWYNAHGLAVVVSGDLTKHPPTAAQLASLETVLAALERQFVVQPYTFAGLTPGTAFGHGELPGKVSSCPGQLLAWVRERRLRALPLPPLPPAPPLTDSAEATAAGRFAALGIAPNRAGAIFRAYVVRTKAWLASGGSAVFDPTPCIRPEWSNGRLARCAFDSGEIYEWRASDGACVLVEAKDRARVWQECGW